MSDFFSLLKVQRWDDHRYYHHSLVNQSLHLLSAVTFVCAYVVMFHDPALAALLGWLVAMTSRQIGHFFFEPRYYDVINQATDDYKEAVKIGYNIRRKIVLMTAWALSPLLLVASPTLMGLVPTHKTWMGFIQHVGYLWLIVGLAGLLFRTAQLFVIKNPLTGMVWMTKILTDPFHDIKLYHRAPIQLARTALIERTLAHSHQEESEDFSH